MLKIIVAVVAFLITVVSIYAASKPGNFHVQRTVTIQAPRKECSPSSTTITTGPRGRPTKSSTPT